MSMGWDDISELRPLTGLLIIPPGDIWVWIARWNDTDRGKPKNSEKNLSQCHFVHHKLHMDGRSSELGPPLWDAGD
jgi:hypothetical protein